MTQIEEKKIYELIDDSDIDLHLTRKQIDIFVDNLKTIRNHHSYIGQVQEFMQFFRQDIGHIKEIPGKGIMILRLNLILEELCELAEACGTDVLDTFVRTLNDKVTKLKSKPSHMGYDKVEAFDALLDLQYVLSGAVLAFGLQNKFDEGFEQVQESNMSKACYNLVDAKITMENYQAKGIECFIDDSDAHEGIWRVLKSIDRKLLKSVSYKPFDGTKLLSDGTENNK